MDTKKTGWKQKILHEMIEYWLIVLYMALFFGVFFNYRRLILAHHQILYEAYGISVIKALVLGKIVLVAERRMDPSLPPRVHLGEFNPDSLNIQFFCWFHPSDYWAFMDFTQRVNLRIMRAFESEGIRFAIPAIRNYLTRADDEVSDADGSADVSFPLYKD